MEAFFNRIEWSPGIGDPTFMGWFTVFAYFLCFYKCLQVIKYSDRIFIDPFKRQRVLWLALVGLLFFLGINKQLDLQSFFTATARYLAMEQGWYDQRHAFQKTFIIAIGAAGVTAMIALCILFHKIFRLHLFAIIGVCVLIVFVLVRALSFHNIDGFLGTKFLGVKANWALELSGIFLIYYNAKKLVLSRRPLVELKTY